MFYYNRAKDAYKADRLIQALEAGEWIQLTSRDVDAVVYCGDLNTGTLPHKLHTRYNIIQNHIRIISRFFFRDVKKCVILILTSSLTK